MNNIVLDFRYNYVRGERLEAQEMVYQYDAGRIVEAYVPEAEPAFFVHVGFENSSEALALIDDVTVEEDAEEGGYKITAVIPDSVLVKYGNLLIYVVGADGDQIVTTYEGFVLVKHKEAAEDYIVPDDQAVNIIERAKAAAITAEASAQIAEAAAAEAMSGTPEGYAALVDTVETLSDTDNLTVGTARQLLSDSYQLDAEPYMFRRSGGGLSIGDREADEIVGGSLVWNQLVGGDASSVTVPNGHKYVSKIGGTWSMAVSAGEAIAVTGGTDNVFDLTAMFNPTVANAIYAMEQANAGAGVAYFRSLFPNDYYEYDHGTLKSVEGVSAHTMRDADNNIIASYPLDASLTLRGVPKWVDGKLVYDGDRYMPDGTVERRYGIVDLGTLDWTTGSSGRHLTNASYIKSVPNTQVFNALCSKYRSVSGNMVGNEDKTIGLVNGYLLQINDSAYNGIDAEEFKTAMSGVMLVYELATPTTETAAPYQEIQQVDPDGTEEYVSSGIVPVGHSTKYFDNLVKKIEGLPWDFSTLIAPTEKTNKASMSYASGDYLIYNNTLYKTTVAITSGETITPGSNISETTVMAEIKALQEGV